MPPQVHSEARRIVDAVHSGELAKAEFEHLATFNLLFAANTFHLYEKDVDDKVRRAGSTL